MIDIAKQVLSDQLSAKKSSLNEISQLTRELAELKPPPQPARRKKAPRQKEWYSPQEAADLTGLSYDTIMRRIHGEGRSRWKNVRHEGRLWLINKEHVFGKPV